MIKLEDTDAERLCTCCRGRGGSIAVKELVFAYNNGPNNATTVALCRKCRKELKNILLAEKEVDEE